MTLVFIFLGTLVLVMQGTHADVFGMPMSDKALDKFFGRHPLENYEYNELGTNLLYSNNRPWIGTCPSLLTRWAIKDHGSVPRWSKWHKKLNAHHLAVREKHYASNNQN